MTTEHNQLHEKLDKLIKEKLFEFNEYIMNLYGGNHISVNTIKSFGTAIKTVEGKSPSVTDSRIDYE